MHDRQMASDAGGEATMPSNELPGELGFEPGEHDVRVERGPWVYWVRGVRSGEPLGRGMVGTGDLVGDFVAGIVAAVASELWWRRRRRWKVGVLRFRGSRWGPQSGAAVIHKEVLPRDIEPAARIAELVEMIQAGEFNEPA